MGGSVSIATRAWAALLIATSACSSGGILPVQPGSGGLTKTGLEGTVRRGPIQPVCREGEPCDAPLQAGFTLQQSDSVVARFASDATGHFLVYVAPGIYMVVPDEPIGLGQQTQEVTVGADSLTHLELTFDTGIR
jgi:hypothetical protein